MPRLVLVRHGRAAAGWGEDADPGLDAVGLAQAEAAADALESMGPLPIITSPLRRTQETAAPLARRWGVEARIEPAVGAIESPTNDLEARSAWLRTVMQGSWADAPDLGAWRQGVIDGLAAIETDAVVVSHFVAINVAVGVATDDDRAVCFMPDNCSRTVIDVDGGRFVLVELGGEAATRVQ